MNINDNINDGQYVLWQYLLSVHVSQRVGESIHQLQNARFE